MSESFSKGDKVKWNSSGGHTRGKVTDVKIKPVTFQGKKYEASNDDPRYIVKSDKSGKKAVHKADALSKASR